MTEHERGFSEAIDLCVQLCEEAYAEANNPGVSAEIMLLMHQIRELKADGEERWPNARA